MPRNYRRTINMSTLSTNESISRAAARLRVGVFAAMLVMVLIYIAARFDLRVAQLHVEYRHGTGPGYGSPVGDGSMALLLIALFRLTEMLKLISGGDLFSTSVIRHFRGFALWLL